MKVYWRLFNKICAVGAVTPDPAKQNRAVIRPSQRQYAHRRKAAVGSLHSRFSLIRLAALTGIAASLVILPDATHAQKTMTDTPLTYPAARRSDHTDAYHGVSVADPYRWLEDADTPETRAWIEAENKVAFGYLTSIPGRDRIEKRMTQLWNYEKVSAPFREGGHTFFYRNTGLQSQSVLYVQDSPTDTPRILLDPNTLSKDGTVALTGIGVSHDGRYLAYGRSTAGSDWQEWRVRTVATGKDLSDHLLWSKFSSASWSHDGQGFYYSRYDAPEKGRELQQANYYQKLAYHKLGTPQAQDALIYERPDQKEWSFDGQVSDDGRYLVVTVFQGTEPKNRVFYKDLQDANGKIIELLPQPDATYRFLDNDGPIFWFLTDKDAPRSRVIGVDTRQPEPAHWREIIPQATDNLDAVSVVGDRFLASYLKDAHTLVKVFGLDGALERTIDLPGIGTAVGFAGKRADRDTYYTYTSYTTPSAVYRYDIAGGQSVLFRQPKTPFRPEDYETKQVFYTSKDGTQVPMFLTHRKGLAYDGTAPTLLYAYGGFRIPIVPYYAPDVATWLEMGGVYAVANLRGGGEYGVAWHEAGRLANKQNVFDDFIAAAEWLVKEKVTSTAKLAIQGASNGGLLIGAVMTQRPDLCAAAIPEVGVMDMLRFQKFTVGWGWVNEYGSSDDPKQFAVLRAYSPLHNLKPGTRYPATLILTSDHDDRVVPAHSFKFAATLQADQSGSAPTLIRIETKAGHGGGKPTGKIIAENVDVYAFLVRTLGMTLPDAFGK